MPKQKSHKGILKRVKITGTGKVKHKRSGGNHRNKHNTGKVRHKLRTDVVCAKSIAKKMEQLLNAKLIGRD